MLTRRTVTGGLAGAAVAAPLSAVWGATALEKRVALVIGNSNYLDAPLPNTKSDASAIGMLLQQPRHGFEVAGGQAQFDLSFAAMRTTLLAFAQTAADTDIALIYFAGHGVSFGDLTAQGSGRAETYLIPTDTVVQSRKDLEQRAISLTNLLTATRAARQARVIVLDSCRNEDFNLQLLAAADQSLIVRGLARPLPSPVGTLIAYAATEGQSAFDGESGRHSPYTNALLQEIPVAGRGIRAAFAAVSKRVYSDTGRKQIPTYSETFDIGDVSFVRGSPGDQNVKITGGPGVPYIIFWEFDVANLTPEASTVLEQAASTYLRGGFRFVQIVGHTDTIGSPSYAQAISERRAFVAKDYLIARGVPPAMISARGAGQAELLVQTEDGVSEPQNRRTTIDLIT